MQTNTNATQVNVNNAARLPPHAVNALRIAHCALCIYCNCLGSLRSIEYFIRPPAWPPLGRRLASKRQAPHSLPLAFLTPPSLPSSFSWIVLPSFSVCAKAVSPDKYFAMAQGLGAWPHSWIKPRLSTYAVGWLVFPGKAPAGSLPRPCLANRPSSCISQHTSTDPGGNWVVWSGCKEGEGACRGLRKHCTRRRSPSRASRPNSTTPHCNCQPSPPSPSPRSAPAARGPSDACTKLLKFQRQSFNQSLPGKTEQSN